MERLDGKTEVREVSVSMNLGFPWDYTEQYPP